jgi:SAM-dependent methyltransferase
VTDLEHIPKSRLAALWAKLGLSIEIKSDLDYRTCLSCGLRFFSPLLTGDQAFYEKLQRFDWYYVDEKAEYNLAVSHLPESGDVLEIGAGKGAFAKHLTAQRYTGLEYSDQAIRFAKKEGIHLEAATVQQFARSERTATFAAVCAFQVLEHVADPHTFLESAVRLLRDGGRLIVAVPAHDSYVGYTTDSTLNLPPHHVTHWTDSTLQAIAPIFGLRLVALLGDELSPLHVASASRAQWSRYLRRLCRIRANPLVSGSRIERIVEKVASLLGRRIRPPGLSKRGHTVVAVFEKQTTPSMSS